MTEPSLPAGACDCHTHVFLDPRAYPWSPARRYTPPPAPIEALVAWHDALGIARVVVVQPSVYAADNAATLQALRVLGPERARGVAVLDATATDADLQAMHALGVRGVRVNLEIDRASDAAEATAQLRETAARVAPLGWHVQVYANLPLLAACQSVLRALPVPVVLDHYAGAHASGGLEQPGLHAVLALVAEGRAYVKLSAPYRLSAAAGHADMAPIARAFIAAGPDRMLWGSDWPHPQPGSRPHPHDISPPFAVDSAQVLAALRAWTPDARTFERILADNPARLYGF
ncbi:amidohydrolase family protein [Pseudorhodoferax sp. LjRoot39]|uniref:amidohydrolase family protein n=1 Tax=Pseudorhodoferax sp. LjRoot39 TaxID=3342328 RepID=UPI003ED059AE